MSYYYVDSITGSDSDNGTTFDLAWATVEHALESGGLTAGDIIWVRPVHSEIPTSDILPAYDGSASSPIQVIGWPRAAIPNTTITQADFTNGSKIIDNVVGVTPNRQQHTNRYITAPDGKQYHITAIIWEAGIDGMAAGAEFAVGEILTNTTQSKKGKVWGFTDNLDTTGTLQYVRDCSTAWVDNDNITSSGGGDAEIDASGETAVGFILSAEYAGATVTGVNGKFQIDADPDYTLAQAIDDSSWTIKKTDWDNQGLPLIDFNNTSYCLNMDSDFFHIFKNIEFLDSTDALGFFYILQTNVFSLEGVLLKKSSNTRGSYLGKSLFKFKRVIYEGSGAGASQVGIESIGSHIEITDCSFMNCGDYGMKFDGYSGFLHYKRLNIGVEMANGDDDIYIARGNRIKGTGLKLGGANGTVSWGYYVTPIDEVKSYNYGKVLNAYKKYFPGGTIEKAAVSGETPNKKVSDDVIKISPNQSGYEYIEDWAVEVFKHEFAADTTSKTYKYWLYNDMGVTLNATTAKDDIWLKLEYINSCDDTSEYTHAEVFSAQTSILDTADADDWDYLEVACQPAIASKVRITCYVSTYAAATANIIIDPAVVIT